MIKINRIKRIMTVIMKNPLMIKIYNYNKKIKIKFNNKINKMKNIKILFKTLQIKNNII
jgi:hypothetical protein